MADRHKNFAYSIVSGTTAINGANPGTTGIYLTVAAGQGRLFPDTPFNATVWPSGAQPTSANAEIVRVIDREAETLTLDNTAGTRNQQEGTSARNIIVGDQIAATITAKTLTDAEGALSTYAPYILASGAASGLQTLASASGQSSTGSLFLFPVTLPQSVQFNQVLLLNSLTWVTNSSTGSNSHYSQFGIYSLNGNTFSLISSNSFSIGETIRSRSATWNFPTTTATSGYGYGNFAAGNLTTTAQYASFVAGTRIVGLQFGGDMTLSGGVYWFGLLSQRSTAVISTAGLSHAGIVGHIIQNINQVGTVSGVVPIGVANSQWSLSNTNVTGWWGRHILGFATATTVAGYGGSVIPNAVTLSQIAGFAANSTATILPTVTFVSY